MVKPSYTIQLIVILVVITVNTGVMIGCKYEVINSYTSVSSNSSNSSNSSWDGDISMYIVSKNQSGCEVNLTEIYNNYTSNIILNKTELFVTFHLNCADAIDIHFTSSMENSKNGSQISMSVEITLFRCAVFVKELNLFQHYGIIWSIQQLNSVSVIHPDSDCSSILDILNIISCVPCNNTDASTTSIVNKFFWEFCEQPFEKVYNLNLEGCFQHDHYITDHLLQNTFPNLQVLHLKYMDLSHIFIKFPWTDVYINKLEATYESYLSSNYVSENISISLPRYIEIDDCIVNITNMKLHGHIFRIKVTNVHLEKLNKEMLSNVNGLVHLDFSYNDLNAIDETALKPHTYLKSLNLKINNLTSLMPNLFHSLHELLSLDLSFNKIRTLNQNLFKNLLKLQELYLEHNEIALITSDFLKDQIPSITQINLSWNPLQTVPENILYAPRLQLLLFRHCPINSSGFLNLVSSINNPELQTTDIDYGRLSVDYDFVQRAELDISYGQIQDFNKIFNKLSLYLKFLSVINSFYIVLTGNPIDCTCVTKLQQTITTAKELYIDWVCMYPSELKGKLISSLTATDIYCPVIIDGCPKWCTCFERSNNQTSNNLREIVNTIIVDCRNVNMTDMPRIMPSGKLELWFKNSSLTQIPAKGYFSNTTVFDASYNRINVLTSAAVTALTTVISLKLDHNNLTRLPVQIMSTNINALTLGRNPFLCDCNTKWIKTWLLNRTSPVNDWSMIECTYNRDKVKQIVSVQDSFFVCHSRQSVSISEHVILPSIVIGCTLFVFVSLSLLMYFQSFTIKVLLFMYCGIHSFDKQKQNDENMDYDIFVLYSQTDAIFIKTNILDMLTCKGYKVCNLFEDLFIGVSFLENVDRTINKSRKILFSLTEEMLSDHLLMSAWSIALERAVNNISDSIILILDTEVENKCNDTKLKRYIKSGKFVKRKSKLLQSSVCYLMPKLDKGRKNGRKDTKVVEEICLPMIEDKNDLQNDLRESLVYISYPDELDDDMRRHVIPALKDTSYKFRIFENEFIPGTDIRDEIYEKLDESTHFLFILSNWPWVAQFKSRFVPGHLYGLTK